MPCLAFQPCSHNLHDVFGEGDPARRRAAIDDIWAEDGVFYDPKSGIHRGRDEIDRVAGAIQATHPDFQYQPIAEPEELGNGGRVRWVSGRPGEPPAYAGTDSSLCGTTGLPPFISFSTRYPERTRMPWYGFINGRREGPLSIVGLEGSLIVTRMLLGLRNSRKKGRDCPGGHTGTHRGPRRSYFCLRTRALRTSTSPIAPNDGRLAGSGR